MEKTGKDGRTWRTGVRQHQIRGGVILFKSTEGGSPSEAGKKCACFRRGDPTKAVKGTSVTTISQRAAKHVNRKGCPFIDPKTERKRGGKTVSEPLFSTNGEGEKGEFVYM